MTRQVLFVLRLAATRIRRRAAAVVLAALGIAAGAAAFAAVLGAATVAQDENLARALQRLPAAERAIRASWFGAYDPALDATALGALRGVSDERPLRALVFRQTSVDGRVFNLGAADRLQRWIRLRSGRLPRGCSPSRCEVIQVAGTGPLPDTAGLRLRRVGVADLVSTVPFLRTTAYGRTVEDSYSFTSPKLAPPFVLTNDVRGAAALPIFRLIHRSYAWILPLRPAAVQPWSFGDLQRRVERARSELTTGNAFFDLTDPLPQLEPVVEAGRVSARRLLLVGGQAAALLLAFVGLAAASGRREAGETRARLTQFGARRWQVALLSSAEAGGVAFLATIVGWLLGAGIVAAIAASAGSPTTGVLSHSVASAGGVAFAAALAVLAATLLVLALRVPARNLARLAISPLDVAALAACLAIALALVRGAADASTLTREGGTGVLLFVLPALIAFAAAVVAVRLLAPLARVLERAARTLSVSGRLAAVSLARQPGRASAVVAFLLVSVGFAVFSVAYRTTLERGQTDQARFQTPADVVLRRSTAQPLPLNAPSLAAAYRPATKRAIPVLRLEGQVGAGLASRQLTVLGIPAGAVRTLPFWRSDFAATSLGRLADAIEPARPVSLRGSRLPADGRTLSLRLRNRGDPLVVTANIAARNGTFVPISLPTVEPGETRIRVPLPVAARGGLLIGLAFAPTLPEVHGGRPAAGTLSLGPLTVGRQPLRLDFGDWIGSGGIRARGRGSTARLSFFLTNDRPSAYRRRQVSDVAVVAAIATPSLASVAGRGGVLPLRIGDVDLNVRVAATARRFPTTTGEFVVADERLLSTALNAVAPGTAELDEVWLDGASRPQERRLTAVLARPPLAGVQATFQRRVESGLRRDPLARTALRTFVGIALVAFVLALVGLALAVAGDLRDEHGELVDLEEQGAGPALLRRHVRLRSAAVVALGILGGAGLGAILSALVVGAVLITASGANPEPPLVLGVDWPALLAGAGVYVALALGLIGLLTWNAFRGEAAT